MHRETTYEVTVGGSHQDVPMDENELQALLWFVLRTTYRIENLKVERQTEDQTDR